MSDDNEPLRLKKLRKTKEVILEGEDGQEEERYTLVEMMGPDREDWLNQHAKRLKIGPDGQPLGITEFKGLFSSLVCRCMFGSDGQKVPKAVFDSWGGSLQQILFAECRKLNGFDSPEEVKKD
jgi:hypothetical protein